MQLLQTWCTASDIVAILCVHWSLSEPPIRVIYQRQIPAGVWGAEAAEPPTTVTRLFAHKRGWGRSNPMNCRSEACEGLYCTCTVNDTCMSTVSQPKGRRSVTLNTDNWAAYVWIEVQESLLLLKYSNLYYSNWRYSSFTPDRALTYEYHVGYPAEHRLKFSEISLLHLSTISNAACSKRISEIITRIYNSCPRPLAHIKVGEALG
jgi:hypothetical protein